MHLWFHLGQKLVYPSVIRGADGGAYRLFQVHECDSDDLPSHPAVSRDCVHHE